MVVKEGTDIVKVKHEVLHIGIKDTVDCSYINVHVWNYVECS